MGALGTIIKLGFGIGAGILLTRYVLDAGKPCDITHPVTVTGKVKHFATREPIEGAYIVFFNEELELPLILTDIDGNFEITLPNGGMYSIFVMAPPPVGELVGELVLLETSRLCSGDVHLDFNL